MYEVAKCLYDSPEVKMILSVSVRLAALLDFLVVMLYAISVRSLYSMI